MRDFYILPQAARLRLRPILMTSFAFIMACCGQTSCAPTNGPLD
jgi:hypothetical protein